MRRGRHASSDSMELMLDTICNVFGGVILMAVLVILQMQTAAGRISTEREEQPGRAVEVRSLTFEAQRLERKLGQLRRQKEIFERTYVGDESPELEKLFKARTEFLTAIDEAERTTDAVDERIGEARKSCVTMDMAVATRQRRRSDLQADIETSQKKLEGLKRRLPERIRLPRQKLAKGRPRYYLVRKDRAYPLEEARWIGEEHVSGHCLVSPLNRHAGLAAEIRPRKGMGYVAPTNGKGGDAFLRSLSPYPPRTHYCVFFVYDDSESFRAFQELKRLILNRRYLYVISAKEPQNEHIVVYPGSHETE